MRSLFFLIGVIFFAIGVLLSLSMSGIAAVQAGIMVVVGAVLIGAAGVMERIDLMRNDLQQLARAAAGTPVESSPAETLGRHMG